MTTIYNRVSLILVVFVMVAISVVGFAPVITNAAEQDEELLAKYAFVALLLSKADLAVEEVRDLFVDTRVQKIEKFFQRYDRPAAQYAKEFVHYADKYNLDWKFVASLAQAESSGFQHVCGYNGFGWNSCKGKAGSFESFEHAIQKVSWNLAGNNPNTAMYYKDKSIEEKIDAYNPPQIVKDYDYKSFIFATMKRIDAQEV